MDWWRWWKVSMWDLLIWVIRGNLPCWSLLRLVFSEIFVYKYIVIAYVMQLFLNIRVSLKILCWHKWNYFFFECRLWKKQLIPVRQLNIKRTLLMILTRGNQILAKQRICWTGSQKYPFVRVFHAWYLIFRTGSWMRMKGKDKNKEDD